MHRWLSGTLSRCFVFYTLGSHFWPDGLLDIFPSFLSFFMFLQEWPLYQNLASRLGKKTIRKNRLDKVLRFRPFFGAATWPKLWPWHKGNSHFLKIDEFFFILLFFAFLIFQSEKWHFFKIRIPALVRVIILKTPKRAKIEKQIKHLGFPIETSLFGGHRLNRYWFFHYFWTHRAYCLRFRFRTPREKACILHKENV